MARPGDRLLADAATARCPALAQGGEVCFGSAPCRCEKMDTAVNIAIDDRSSPRQRRSK